MAKLAINIRTGDSRPIFKQIIDEFSKAIASGKLSQGDKLPSVRALSVQLSINPNTVAKAYSELASLGLVDTHPGLGLFVAEPKQLLSNMERKKRLTSASKQFVSDVINLHFTDKEILDSLETELLASRGVRKTGTV